MKVIVNGETRDIPDGIDLEALMKHLSMPMQRVALELNNNVIRRADWTKVRVGDDDKIEIVHFVGGG